MDDRQNNDELAMAFEEQLRVEEKEQYSNSSKRYRHARSNDLDCAVRHSWYGRLNKWVIVSLCLILPLWFGGVHPFVYLTVYCAVISLALILVFRESTVHSFFYEKCQYPATLVVMRTLLVFSGVLLLNFAWHFLVTKPHPLLGEARQLAAIGPVLNGLLTVAFCCAVFFLFRCQMACYKTSPFWFVKIIKYLVLIVGLTALSHWFYDNGRLFWTFEADHTFVSDRARWPFVNSNHLGIFLLQPVFILLAALAINTLGIVDANLSSGPIRQRHNKFIELLLNSRVQRLLLDLFFSFILLVIALIAIIGSLSRGTWLGISLGLLVYIVLSRNGRGSPSLGHSVDSGDSCASDTRRKGRGLHSKPKYSFKARGGFELDRVVAIMSGFSRPLLFLLALGAVVFFLYGRGLDLFESRVEFGLMYSKDDMRWQLFADTLAILKDNFLMGIGLGNWAEVYPQYMNYQLAGINPGFLHSDPYQLLVEVGLLGVTPLLFLAVYFTVNVVRARKQLDRKQAYLLVAVYCGMLSTVISSLLDFPFRVPALSVLFLGNLAILAAIIDGAGNTERNEDPKIRQSRF